MKEEFLKLPLVRNEEKSRFELEVDGYTAFAEYLEQGKVIKLTHTESPQELAGKGVGTAIVEKTLDYLKNNGYQFIPLCPFVFSYVKRHPEWKPLVPEQFRYNFDK